MASSLVNMLTIVVFIMAYQQIRAIDSEECRDRIPCGRLEFQCQNERLQMTMRAMCKQTCGFCEETECKDYQSNCDLYQQRGMCHFVESSCKRTCGKCEDNDDNDGSNGDDNNDNDNSNDNDGNDGNDWDDNNDNNEDDKRFL